MGLRRGPERTALHLRVPKSRTHQFYWFGRSSCLNVSVLTSRNIGVPGGSIVGNRKSLSNAKLR